MIKTSKINGLTVYQVIFRGCVIGTFMSLAGAKTQCLRILNSLGKKEFNENGEL